MPDRARLGHRLAANVPGGDRALLAQTPPRLRGENRAPPGAAEEELRGFRPHLLVHNDTDGLDRSVLEGVPCWVEVCYSDSMNAKISVDGRVEEARDISTDDLLRAADETVARVRGA